MHLNFGKKKKMVNWLAAKAKRVRAIALPQNLDLKKLPIPDPGNHSKFRLLIPFQNLDLGIHLSNTTHTAGVLY